MNAKIEKPNSVQPLGKVNIKPIQAQLELITEKIWNVENDRKENNFNCFHHTQHIVFRFISGQRNNPGDFHDNPAWLLWRNILLPVMETAVLPFEFEEPVFPKAMLAKLKSGYEIDEHVDQAMANLYTHKIHIPVYTNSSCYFCVNGKPFQLEEGYAYEVNNSVTHSASNHGETDRVHFIFEVFDNAN